MEGIDILIKNLLVLGQTSSTGILAVISALRGTA